MLCPVGAVAAVEVRGGASGLLGLDVLDPGHIATRVHGAVLAGGSAFGPRRASASRRTPRHAGSASPPPAASCRWSSGPSSTISRWARPTSGPTAPMGARAAAQAASGPVRKARSAPGAGASVGKAFGLARAMKGGLGTASRQVGPATVGALVAVNAFGDVRDPATGTLLAGARDAPAGHRLVDTARQLREGRITPGFRQTHTTIGIVATDVPLDGAEARRVAALAHLGLAAALSPPHLSVDGDALFCLATGSARAPTRPPPTPSDSSRRTAWPRPSSAGFAARPRSAGCRPGATSSPARAGTPERQAEARRVTGRVIPFPSRAPEPPEPDNERGFEELTRVGDQAEALVVRGLLEAHGIEALLRSQVAPSVYPFSVGEQGAVQVARPPRGARREPPPPRPGHPGPVLSLATAGPRRSARRGVEGPHEDLERPLHGGQRRKLERLREVAGGVIGREGRRAPGGRDQDAATPP